MDLHGLRAWPCTRSPIQMTFIPASSTQTGYSIESFPPKSLHGQFAYRNHLLCDCLDPFSAYTDACCGLSFHVGIDLAMNMHCFEWLTLIGWTSFLAQPDPSIKKSGLLCKSLGNLIIVGVLSAFAIDALPVDIVYNLTPEQPANCVTRKFQDVMSNISNYQRVAY